MIKNIRMSDKLFLKTLFAKVEEDKSLQQVLCSVYFYFITDWRLFHEIENKENQVFHKLESNLNP